MMFESFIAITQITFISWGFDLHMRDKGHLCNRRTTKGFSMSEHIACRVNVNPAQALEYEKRHVEILHEFAQVSFKHVFLLR